MNAIESCALPDDIIDDHRVAFFGQHAAADLQIHAQVFSKFIVGHFSLFGQSLWSK
jgi:hypothetical protein